jgi:hypothetical protein
MSVATTRLLGLLVLGVSLAACSIPEETFTPLACNVTTCGEGATCVDIDNVASCVCDAGLQDKDGDGNCTATCDSMTCPTKMSCDDSSGTATCGCNAGFQDNDKDGTCTYSCEVTDCAAGGTCSDASGVATCACGPGFQDKDSDNKCEPSCDNTDCGANGCDDSSGTPICVCDLTCGTNALCVVRNNVGACECTGSFVDFDGDGNCTSTCGPNLLNSTLTGGSASVVSTASTGNYQNMSYGGVSTCTNRHDAGGILCDHPPTTNDPKAYTNKNPISGARYYSFNNPSNGTGVVVLDAGSSITFNSIELFQHFRRQDTFTLFSGINQMRVSVHASTTTAPAYNDGGWVTLTTNPFAVSPTLSDGTTLTRPGVWFGSNQTSRFIRIETTNTSYRMGIQAVKGFLCQ